MITKIETEIRHAHAIGEQFFHDGWWFEIVNIDGVDGGRYQYRQVTDDEGGLGYTYWHDRITYIDNLNGPIKEWRTKPIPIPEFWINRYAHSTRGSYWGSAYSDVKSAEDNTTILGYEGTLHVKSDGTTEWLKL